MKDGQIIITVNNRLEDYFETQDKGLRSQQQKYFIQNIDRKKERLEFLS